MKMTTIRIDERAMIEVSGWLSHPNLIIVGKKCV